MSLVRAGSNVELLTRTTYKMIRPFEAMALLLQATNLATSAANDRYSASARQIVLELAAVHLVLAILVLRYRGPLTRGHAWTAVWVAAMFVTQVAVASLLAPGDFGAYGYGIPVGNYGLILLTVFAFYPWGGFRNPRRRWFIEIGLIVAVVLHPLLVLGVMHHWSLSFLYVKSVLLFGVWAVVWYLIGKGMARLCRIAVEVESEALVRSYETALGDFHSYVETAAAGIEAGRDVSEVSQHLRDITYQRRRQLLLEEQQVGVVDVFKNAVRLFGDRLTLLSPPRLGALTLPREPAMLLERALVDLLKNVVDHGGGAVDIDFTMRDGTIVLDVLDHGPGMSRTAFEDPSSSMQRLRAEALRRGGDLTLRAPDGSGAAVRLVLPFRTGG